MYLGLMFYAGRLDKFIPFNPKNSQADMTALSGRGARPLQPRLSSPGGEGDKAAFVYPDKEQGAGASH